ncbi:hypothetical protein ANN_27056, partial [Periplaneta americana]
MPLKHSWGNGDNYRELEDVVWLCDLAFLTDFTGKSSSLIIIIIIIVLA